MRNTRREILLIISVAAAKLGSAADQLQLGAHCNNAAALIASLRCQSDTHLRIVGPQQNSLAYAGGGNIWLTILGEAAMQ